MALVSSPTPRKLLAEHALEYAPRLEAALSRGKAGRLGSLYVVARALRRTLERPELWGRWRLAQSPQGGGIN